MSLEQERRVINDIEEAERFRKEQGHWAQIPIPCPFCASTEFGYREQYKVWCSDCGAEGPDAEGWDEAVLAWNQRT